MSGIDGYEACGHTDNPGEHFYIEDVLGGAYKLPCHDEVIYDVWDVVDKAGEDKGEDTCISIFRSVFAGKPLKDHHSVYIHKEGKDNRKVADGAKLGDCPVDIVFYYAEAKHQMV